MNDEHSSCSFPNIHDEECSYGFLTDTCASKINFFNTIHFWGSKNDLNL